MEFVKTFPNESSISAFESACGVGVVVTAAEIKSSVSKLIEENRKDLVENRYRFNMGKLLGELRATLKWADGKLVKEEVDRQVLEILGPKTEADMAKPAKSKAKAPKTETVKRSPGKTEEKKGS